MMIIVSGINWDTIFLFSKNYCNGFFVQNKTENYNIYIYIPQ